MRPSRRLCIFARAPILGAVKRRIARDLGDEVALTAHTRLVEHTLERCAGRDDYAVDLCIADGVLDDPLLQGWSKRHGIHLTHQIGSGLGPRMAHALGESLAAGVIPVLIGSDCPDIDHGYVMEAFAQLEEADLVLGPALDGGYGLIGLRTVAPGIFVDVPWGTSRVLSVTESRACELGLTFKQLAPIQDVDTADDWRRYLATFD